MIKDFIFYGLMGWIMEILWTGILSLKEGNRRLTGYTYLYMFPIYGCAVFLEPVFMLLAGKGIFIRGIIYMMCIFSAEYVSGYLVEKAVGVCPWDYTKAKYNIDGFIRLDYAPLWFLAGLWFEFLFFNFLR